MYRISVDDSPVCRQLHTSIAATGSGTLDDFAFMRDFAQLTDVISGAIYTPAYNGETAIHR